MVLADWQEEGAGIPKRAVFTGKSLPDASVPENWQAACDDSGGLGRRLVVAGVARPGMQRAAVVGISKLALPGGVQYPIVSCLSGTGARMSLEEKVRLNGWQRYAGILHDLAVAGAAFFLAYVTVIGWYAATSNSIVWEKTLTFIPIAWRRLSGLLGASRFVALCLDPGIPDHHQGFGGRGRRLYVRIVPAVARHQRAAFGAGAGRHVPDRRSGRSAAGLSPVPRGQHPADLGAEGFRPRRPQRPAARHDRQRRKLHPPDAPRLAGRPQRRRRPRRDAAPARPLRAGRQGLRRASRSGTNRQQAGAKGHQGHRAGRDRDVARAGSALAISSKGRPASASRLRGFPTSPRPRN